MADIKISQLVELAAADLRDSDVLIINDVSTTTTKQITKANLLSEYTQNVVDSAEGAKVTGDFEVENELTIGGDTFTTGKITFGSLQDYTENIFVSKFVDQADGIANNLTDSSIPTSLATSSYVTNQINSIVGSVSNYEGTLSIDSNDHLLLGDSAAGTTNFVVLQGRGTGVNQTSEIQALIDKAVPYSTIYLTGKFGFTGLTINTEGLRIILNGILKQFDASRTTDHITVNASNVSFIDGVYDGSLTRGSIIRFNDISEYGTVRNVRFKDLAADASVGSGDWSAIVFEQPDGAGTPGAKFGTVENCEFRNMLNTGASNDSFPRGITVLADDVRTIGLRFFSVQNPHYVGVSAGGKRFVSHNAYLKDTIDNGFYMNTSDVYIFSPTIIRDSDEPFVFLSNCDNILVKDAYIEDHGNAIAFDDCGAITFDGLRMNSRQCASFIKTRTGNVNTERLVIRNSSLEGSALFQAMEFVNGSLDEFVFENNEITHFYDEADRTLTFSNATQTNPCVVTTSAVNKFRNGESVTVAGVVPTGYNGTYTITAVNTNKEFEISLDASSLGPITTNGTITSAVLYNSEKELFKFDEVAEFTIRNNTFILRDGNATSPAEDNFLIFNDTVFDLDSANDVWQNNKLLAKNTAADFRIPANRLRNNSPIPYLQYNIGQVRDNVNEKPMFWVSEPPTSGSYRYGTVAFNYLPDIGDPMGWVYVEDAVNGDAWRPFGSNQRSLAFNRLNFGSDIRTLSSNRIGATQQLYTPSNVTTSRTFDADTVTVAELADIVGTLISDLETANVIPTGSAGINPLNQKLDSVTDVLSTVIKDLTNHKIFGEP